MRARASIGATLAAAAIAVGAITIQSGAAAQEGNPSAGDPPNDSTTGDTSRTGDTATRTKTVTATATIAKLDKDTGMVTLRGANGQTVDVKTGPDVHMDQLKVGDKVNATYFEEVAVSISKPGQGQPKSTQTTVQRGGVTSRQATMTAQILSVDQKKNTVLIRGPQGKTHSIEVQDPNVQAQLGRIKPGDNVDITYTQAVATSLEPIK